MSEVNRYEWTRNGMRVYATPMGRYVQSTDFDAAQSELAALQEDLDKALDMIKQSRERNAKLRKRLTAAEQWNAELIELLNSISKVYGSALSKFTLEKIDAALKPTESGASE